VSFTGAAFKLPYALFCLTMADFNDGVDGKLAFRMRRVNPEQFHTLVRMHLSFELDLNTEE